MGRVEAPAEPDLHQGQVHALAGEPPECEGREQLELGRSTLAPRDAVGDRHGAEHQGRERRRVDRPAGDAEALPVGDEMRLGVFLRVR